jgi:hypothetical protein
MQTMERGLSLAELRERESWVASIIDNLLAEERAAS